MPWNPEESLSRQDLTKLQGERLQKVCERVYARVPFYTRKFDELGLKPSSLKSVKDIVKLPFTRKTDLRENYPYGLFAEPLEDIVRIHASSGTMSNPTVVGYSRGDLSTWSELCARVAVAGGARSHDVAQIAFEYGLTTGAFGMHAGLERVGVTVIPASGRPQCTVSSGQFRASSPVSRTSGMRTAAPPDTSARTTSPY